MRVLVAVAGLVGCYTPSPPAGAPCDPQANNCPAGQACRAEAGGHFCRLPGTLTDDPDAPSPIDAPASPVDAPDGALPPATFTYPAEIAECIDPALPSPARCRMVNGNAQLVVDLSDTAQDVEWQGYIAVRLDDKLAGRTVVSAKLRVVATDDANADSPNSGQLWNVEPFTLQSLGTTTPPRIGNDPLAGSQGAVAKLQPVEWPVPAALVVPNGAVFLSIQTTATTGVNYWNTAGPNPPQLIVDVQ